MVLISASIEISLVYFPAGGFGSAQNRAEIMCRIVQIICAESCVAVMCLQNAPRNFAEFCTNFVQNRAQILCRILQRISADMGPKDEPGFS